MSYGAERTYLLVIHPINLDDTKNWLKVVWTLPSKLDGLLTEIIYSPVDTRYYRLLSERLRAIFEKQNSGAGYKYS